MEIGKKFANLELYNENMTKSLKDKMFFVDHLPECSSFVFVDFGCADGTMINALYQLFGRAGHQYIGYDVSEQMIDLAKTKMSESPTPVHFTSDWSEVLKVLSGCENHKKVLILNSVIHEVYSYAKGYQDIDLFWKRVINGDWNYICVRDMMVPADTLETPTPDNYIKHIYEDFGLHMSNERFIEFENLWGPISNKQSALHFLLKYRWQINWNREVHENYFPIFIEDFLKQFEDRYNLDYFERFRIPFLDECLKTDFHLVLNDTDSTHIKAIFSLKTFK